MFRIGICDDDEQFTLQMENFVSEYANKNDISVEIHTFLNAEKLFLSIREDGPFEILFLDIELGDNTGIDIGKIIRSDLKNEIMQIVFISAKEEYALQLFDIRPMNFLIKPVDYQKVAYIMDEYERLFYRHNSYFTYNVGKRTYRMYENCILYFQSQGKKIQMVTLDGTEEFYGKLSDVVSQLNEQMFCIVHKSYVINLRYVAQYRSDSIVMVNGDEIPVSQSMKQKVKERILNDIL